MCLTQAPGPTEEPWSDDPGGLTVLNHTKLIINSTHLLSAVFSFRQSQVKFAACNTSYYFLKSLRSLGNLTGKRIAQLFWKFLIPVVLQIREDRTLSMDEWCFELTPICNIEGICNRLMCDSISNVLCLYWFYLCQHRCSSVSVLEQGSYQASHFLSATFMCQGTLVGNIETSNINPLLTVWFTILVISIWRIWYWIN